MEILTAVWLWLLDGHTGLLLKDYVLNAVFAAMGASVTVFASNPRIKMPRYADGEWEPGALGMYVIGISTATAIGHRIPVPFIAGMLAPILVPTLLKNTVPTLLDIGLKVLNPWLAASVEAAAEKRRSQGEKDK